MIKRPFLTLLIVQLLLTSVPVQAKAVSADEITVFVNAIKYVRGLSDEAKRDFSVLYDPDVQVSVDEALSFVEAAKQLESVNATMVTIDKLPQDSPSVVYISSGLQHIYPKLRAMEAIFTVSRDKNCAKIDCCVLAVVKLPASLNIYLNELAMREYGFGVDPVFKFMAKRVGGDQ